MWQKPDLSLCVSKETRSQRIEICQSCENKKDFSGIELCVLCNCIIPWKTWLKKAECPIQKWGANEG